MIQKVNLNFYIVDSSILTERETNMRELDDLTIASFWVRKQNFS